MDWVMGKIQKCPEVTQARFVRLLCLYWNKECDMTVEDAEIEIDKDHLDILISKRIVRVDDAGLLSITFLDEQMMEIGESREKKREAANKRWQKQSESNADAMHVHTDAMQNDADKRREEKIREDKRRKKNSSRFTPPDEIEVVGYFIEHGFPENLAKKAYAYYSAGNWSDGKGNPVRNWKQKMHSVWFKEENKTSTLPKKDIYESVRQRTG